MSHLRSLPSETTTLLELFRAHPRPVGPLLDLHERIMRDDSPLTPGQRELIAAYVSGLNGCGYCHGIHTATAEAFGVADGVLEAALADLDTAPVDAALRPVLRYAGLLTLTPDQVGPADAEAVYAAGWDEQALHDAIYVCALFNFMNRVVEGVGIPSDESYARISGRRLAEIGYGGLADLI